MIMKSAQIQHQGKYFYVQFIKAFCALQVFFLHYFAGHGLREWMWIFNVAVPTFLLISAYLYGQRDNASFGWSFLKRRFHALSVIYYPFIFAVAVGLVIIGSQPLYIIFRGLLADFFYLVGGVITTGIFLVVGTCGL